MLRQRMPCCAAAAQALAKYDENNVGGIN